MPTNRAAWIRGPKSYPLEVGPATFPTPKSGEVIIKAQTYALVRRQPQFNPVEWKVQEQDFFVKTYPFILGADVAGYVEDVGEGVTHVQKGQRVMGYCIGLGVNDPAFGGFQLYPTLFASLVCPIPDSLSFDEAAVAPLAVTTAAVNLYHRSHLGLPLPSLNPQSSGKAILQEFLPESIRRGSFQLQPPPVIVGKGLSDIQQGLDKLRSGVSGEKFIVHV
ncbi:Uncharacterized protein HZ326_15740 [Fusarium oxysporum f. sp. albedinis]|nr:Uncharacterized protein HZ326_15740 [Fusarium oxysporum f. sp. albedinis]